MCDGQVGVVRPDEECNAPEPEQQAARAAQRELLSVRPERAEADDPEREARVQQRDFVRGQVVQRMRARAVAGR